MVNTKLILGRLLGGVIFTVGLYLFKNAVPDPKATYGLLLVVLGLLVGYMFSKK